MALPISIRARDLCAILAVGLSAGVFHASKATASCGDWLASHDADTRMNHDVSDRSPGTMLQGFPGDERNDRSVPCHGPNCGQAPRLPFHAPAPDVSSNNDERLGYVIASLFRLPQATQWSAPCDDAPAENLERAPPEHPPRIGA
jgi:hypothetical protein